MTKSTSRLVSLPEAAAFALLLLVPLITRRYGIGVMVQIWILACLGMAWNLLAGYTGLYSFGNAAFFGVGAYTTGILFTRYGVSPWIGMLLGGIAAAILAMAMAFITRKLVGLFFGLVTFGSSLVLGVLATHFSGLTGGAPGMTLPLLGNAPAMMQFGDSRAFYYLGIVVVAFLGLFMKGLLRSRYGLLLRATCSDPVAAEASGVPTFWVKMVSLSLSAFFTALGGAYLLQFTLFIDPASAFGTTQSVNILFPVIIGGIGTIWGPVAGAAIVVALQEIGNAYFPGNGVLSVVFSSTIVLAILVLAPRGLAGLATAGWNRFAYRRESQ